MHAVYERCIPWDFTNELSIQSVRVFNDCIAGSPPPRRYNRALQRLLIDEPPTYTPSVWRLRKYLVDRTNNRYWELTAAYDGSFASSAMTGPHVWPANGHPPAWISPMDVQVLTGYHGLKQV